MNKSCNRVQAKVVLLMYRVTAASGKERFNIGCITIKVRHTACFGRGGRVEKTGREKLSGIERVRTIRLVGLELNWVDGVRTIQRLVTYISKCHFLFVIHVVDVQNALVDEVVQTRIRPHQYFLCQQQGWGQGGTQEGWVDKNERARERDR